MYRCMAMCGFLSFRAAGMAGRFGLSAWAALALAVVPAGSAVALDRIAREPSEPARVSKVDALTVKQGVATAGGAAYLKIEGIEGEAGDARHKGEIDVLSWSWGTGRRQAAASGGRPPAEGAGTLTLVVRSGKASPKLFEAAARAQRHPVVVLSLPPEKKGGPSLTITLEDVLITSVQPAGADRGQPTESVSLAYARVSIGD